MTTTTDIGNRALQLVGTRTTMTSLAEQSNEAQQINLVFTAIQNWCSGLANWNFARATLPLNLLKGPATGSVWNGVLDPSPGWNYEYAIPINFVRAIYLTNSATNSGTSALANFIGEPKRFVVAFDTISSIPQIVILTNESTAILVYTSFISDPTLWPWYFERLMVIALAQTICMALTGDKKLFGELSTMLEQQINVSTQINIAEGLIIGDTTPEWIQALGINYPFRRIDSRSPPQPPQPQRGGNSQ
jgi:hypothetical protein